MNLPQRDEKRWERSGSSNDISIGTSTGSGRGSPSDGGVSSSEKKGKTFN